MKNETKSLFQRLKDFINDTYVNRGAVFTTRDMCKYVDEPHTNSTYWKRSSNNPNYTTHIYLGELHKLGCVTRISRGHYKINAPIPAYFGSLHFSGLKGRLEHKSNLYWNSLPSWQKISPWGTPGTMSKALEASSQARDKNLRAKFPANVEGSIEQRLASVESLMEEQLQRLQELKNTATYLRTELDKQAVELRYFSEFTRRVFEITYMGTDYIVTQVFNSDDVFEEPHWRATNQHDEPLTTELEKFLISKVQAEHMPVCN